MFFNAWSPPNSVLGLLKPWASCEWVRWTCTFIDRRTAVPPFAGLLIPWYIRMAANKSIMSIVPACKQNTVAAGDPHTIFWDMVVWTVVWTRIKNLPFASIPTMLTFNGYKWVIIPTNGKDKNKHVSIHLHQQEKGHGTFFVY